MTGGRGWREVQRREIKIVDGGRDWREVEMEVGGDGNRWRGEEMKMVGKWKRMEGGGDTDRWRWEEMKRSGRRWRPFYCLLSLFSCFLFLL